MVAALLLLVSSLVAAQSTGVGAVEYLEGDVRIDGRPAYLGQEVELGSWVQTGPNGAAEVVFEGANVFRLGSNTVAVLSIGRSRQEVDLKHGSMAAVFDRLRTLSGRDTFDVRTPTGAGGVRGTSFFFRVVNSETTYVCACNGTLELAPSNEDSFVESAVAHSAYYFRRTEGGVSVEEAELQFHDTESLNELAATVDVTIPWGELPE
jgi:hypothetical protein